MDFEHYTNEAVDLAVALVNTDQRFHGGEDGIGDLSSLKAFLKDYEGLWQGAAKPAGRDDLEAVHQLRESLRGVVSASDAADASERLNVILSENHANPHVSVHSGRPHLHFEPSDSAMHSWLGVVTAMGFATVLVHHGTERFGFCRADRCEDVFVDTSKNRSRGHCSTQCSTREAVAAYRSRQ